MKKWIKRISIILVLIIISIYGFLSLNQGNNRKQKIHKILKNEYYSYLPQEAKNYIEEVYEKTGELVLTEKNKKENSPYLNPQYIDYLTLNQEEKEETELIPEIYTIDYVEKNVGATQLPSKFDLRNYGNKNYLAEIRDQGNLEICWAITSMENAETYLLYKNGTSYQNRSQMFSSRQLDYATSTNGMSYYNGSGYSEWDNSANGYRQLTSAGNYYMASLAMANGLSMVSYNTFPWNESKATRQPGEVLNYNNSKYEANSTIQLAQINEDNPSTSTVNSYVTQVKNYMIQYGGPFVATYSSDSTCAFKNSDGKYVLKTNTACTEKNANLGHAMQIIGWDDTYPYRYCASGSDNLAATYNSYTNSYSCSSGTLTTGKGAWILKNSWGENSTSYIYLTYNSIKMGVSFVTSLSDMSNRTWDNNYHNNPWSGSGPYISTGQTTEFEKTADNIEKIEKVKFMPYTKNGTYSITIYNGSQTYANQQTITVDEAGIATFDLSSKNIRLTNDTFRVRIASSNSAMFIVDSISVFTSNVDKTPKMVVYSDKSYDSEDPLSNSNPLYIDSNGNYSFQLYFDTKNIPANANITYQIRNGSTTTTSFATITNLYLVDGYGETIISGNVNTNGISCGESWTLELIYNGVVVDSFPIKISGNGQNTQSTVRFYANNGTNNYYDKLVYDKTNFKLNDISLDPEQFAKEGYYIKGWNTKSDGSGTSYGMEDSIYIYSNVDLYAEWSNDGLSAKITYKCKETDNCTSGDTTTNTVFYSQNVVFKTNYFKKTGYTFLYWTDDSNNVYYEGDIVPLEELIPNMIYNNQIYNIYPVFASETNTITFNSNGGTGSMKNLVVASNQDTRLRENTFTKENYIFLNWNTKSDGSGTSYQDNQIININQDITLYAIWLFDNCNITYSSNYGSLSTNSQKVSCYEPTTIANNRFSRSDYKFVGWNTKSDGSGTSYQEGESINLSTLNVENMTLYAEWRSIPKVSYTTHVQTYGWQNYVQNGTISGTTGEAKRLEGIKIRLLNSPYSGNIEYRTHIQSYGWESVWKKNNIMSGTEGEAKRLEAIQIRLTGEISNYYDVYYQVHAQKFGWLGWAKNGENAGTAAYAYRLEGIRIKLVEKNQSVQGYGKEDAFKRKLVNYTTHVESYGWQEVTFDGNMSGTSGEAKRLEAISIYLESPEYTGNIEYKTHIQSYGWESSYKKNGEISGTQGEAKRLEAIQIRLTGQMAVHYDVYYRVHAQTYGWLGWAKNGASSGTAGLQKRLEAIEIVLVEKGKSPPTRTDTNYSKAFIQG